MDIEIIISLIVFAFFARNILSDEASTSSIFIFGDLSYNDFMIEYNIFCKYNNMYLMSK